MNHSQPLTLLAATKETVSRDVEVGGGDDDVDGIAAATAFAFDDVTSGSALECATVVIDGTADFAVDQTTTFAFDSTLFSIPDVIVYLDQIDSDGITVDPDS